MLFMPTSILKRTCKVVVKMPYLNGLCGGNDCSYDVISGVNVSMMGLFGSLTLFTVMVGFISSPKQIVARHLIFLEISRLL